MKASLNPAPSAAPPQPLLTSPARAAAALLLLLALGLSMQAQGQSLEIRVVKKPDEAAAPTFLALNEGETREIEVRLSFAPNQVRHLEAHPPAGVIAREPGTRFGTLYYEPNQGRTWKTLRITAIQDDDHRHVDGTITFMYWCCGGVSNSTASGSIRVTVQDDDLPDVVVTPRPVVVDEGTSSTFSVTLSKQPHSAVRLALTSDGIAFSPSTVTLTPSDWNVPHAVTITAAEDADKENEVGTVNISHVNVNDRPVTVTIIDNDATPVGVTLSAPEVVVTEGGSNTFTVRLAAAPNGRKIVRLASDNPDVTLSPASLTFTASNWSAAQTVTASAAEDGRAEDETALITLSGIGIASGSTLVRVRDNDFAGHLSIAPTVITITEGDKITASSQLAQALTVSVDHEPTLDNLSLLLGDPAGSAALRVGTGDAGIAMQYRRGSTGTAAGGTPVPLSATDFIEALEDDNTVDETYTIPITVRATNGDYGGFEGATADITVHVLDNDPVVLRLSAASLVMEEGGSGDFTVRMRNRPGASHTVTLASNNPDVMVSPASLTFTTTNWSAAQTVTVSAARDADATEDVAHINFDSANDDVSATPVAVRVREIVEMTLTPAALRLAEGGTATFTVQLAGRPHSDTTLSLASDNADVTIDTDPAAAGDQATLSFTSANWSAARTVTLSAAEDADTAGDSATVSITGAAVVDSALAVTVDENDVIPLTLSAGELTIGEGQSQSFTVQLESRPNSLRGVSLVSDSADVTLSTASLAFTTTNWNVAQTVTVSAEDDADSADERARISLTGDGIESASVSVTAVDDDIGFTLSAASLRLDEGASGSLGVRLDAQPSGSRTVTLVSDNDAVTLNPASLDFTTANWSTAQPVTVTALEDADFDDDSAQISLSSPNVADAEATVTVTDNDIVGLMLSTGQLTLHENQSGSFTARLQSRPNSVRAISIASDNTDVTLSTVSLAFTRDNWDTPQRVTASVRADADKADETAHISLAGAGVLAASVSMQVIDDGIGYALSASSLRLDEGASGSFHVRLDAQPDYDRSVALSSSNADVEVSPTTLEFTPANWSIGHHVTVSAAQDDDADADTARISLASDGTVTRNVGVVVVEDDVLGIQVTGAPLALDEGASGSLMVRLSAAPLRATTVALASDYAGVTLEPASLSFTASNWGAPQTVTVSAADDADSGDETAEVTLTAGGLDTVRAAVSVEDDETLGIVVTGAPLTLDEGASGDLMVRLSLDPDADTTVQLTSDSSGIALSPATLSFTAGAGGNWNTAQRVTVSALQDLDALDETAEVSLTAPGAATVTARVSVDDDETLGIHIPSAPLSVAEGASAALSVRLTAAPPANTSVTVASDNDSVELSPTTLNFTPANWNIDQPVTVTAGQDADAADAASVINLTSPDLAPARVEVAIDDDEAAEMTLSNHSMSLHELDTGKFTVSLSAPPRVNVVVKLTSDSSDAIEISPIALIFTPADWSGQEVSITALDDPDALSPEDTTITVTAFGGSFDRLSGQVVVSVTDDDAEGLNLPGGVIRIDEGDAATFEVSLRSRPTDRVTLTLALSRTDSGVSLDTDASDAGDQNMLQFDASSWRTPRTVTLRAGNDADARDEPVTIRVTADGADYGDIDGEVSVLVIDRQTASIVLSGVGDGGIAVEEGRTAEFSVRLASEPSDSVTLTVTSADATALSPGADGSGATRTLGFTAANWNTGQSVRLTAVDDEDREGERVAVSIQAAGGDYDNLSASFTVTVSDDDAGAAPEQEAAAAELVLAEIVSAVLPAASDTIALRFGAPRGARTASVDGRRIALDRSLARDLAAGFAGRAGARGGSEDGRFDRDRFGAERHSADWLGGVPLEDGRPLRTAGQRPSSGRGALLDGFSYALSPLSPAAGGGGWSIWGRIDSGEFSGTSDGVEFDGSRSSAWFGFDRRSEAGILSGMAFSSSGADADYTLGRFGAAIETSMTVVLPYVEISTDDGVAGHIMLGVVSGDATLTQTDQMEGTADLSMYLMSAGGSWPAAEFGSATLSWSGDIGFSTLQTSGSELASLRDLSASSMQIRGGAELVHSGFGEAVRAMPRIALQLRHDAGDGITGTGVELSAGVQMLSASERLSVDLSVRSLTTHSAEDLSDWGAGLQLRLHPKGGGEGLGFALGPTWGNAEDDDLLERDDAFGLDGADLQNRRRRAQHRGMAGNIGYGLRTLGGLLTPYSEYRYTGGEYGGARQVAGVKFADGERLDLRLFSERQVSGRGETRSRLAVELQRRF